jgi:hypothetical protein
MNHAAAASIFHVRPPRFAGFGQIFVGVVRYASIPLLIYGKAKNL